MENGYGYLGILKPNRVNDQKMMGNIQKKYTRQKIQVQKIVRSKVNGVNSFMPIKSWSFAVNKYNVGVVHWQKDELQMQKNYWAYHPQSNKDKKK